MNFRIAYNKRRHGDVFSIAAAPPFQSRACCRRCPNKSELPLVSQSPWMSALGRLATTSQASHACPPTCGGLAMNITATCTRRPWNKGKLVGQKTPLRLRDIWAIRVRLQLAERTRDLALFDLAIDSKLRACDLTKLRVCDVAHGEHVSSRAMVMQQKTKRPVQFEISKRSINPT